MFKVGGLERIIQPRALQEDDIFFDKLVLEQLRCTVCSGTVLLRRIGTMGLYWKHYGENSYFECPVVQPVMPVKDLVEEMMQAVHPEGPGLNTTTAELAEAQAAIRHARRMLRAIEYGPSVPLLSEHAIEVRDAWLDLPAVKAAMEAKQ